MPHDSAISGSDTQSLFRTIRYGMTIVWRAGSRYCIAMGIGALLAALLAPMSIVMLGLIVSEINETITSKTTLSRSLDAWVLLVAVAAFLGVVLSAAQGYAKLRLKDALSLEIQKRFLRHAATLDANILDDRTCQNVLERANQNPAQKLLELMDGMIQTATGSVQILTLAGVLLWIEPWWTLGFAYGGDSDLHRFVLDFADQKLLSPHPHDAASLDQLPRENAHPSRVVAGCTSTRNLPVDARSTRRTNA
jgi:ABC-type multidrug transport system fused ATPase/permease subunit